MTRSSTDPLIVHSRHYSLDKYVTQRSHLIYRSPFPPQPRHWRKVNNSHNKWASKWQTPFTPAANVQFKTRQILDTYRVLKISQGDLLTKRVQNPSHSELSQHLLPHATTRLWLAWPPSRHWPCNLTRSKGKHLSMYSSPKNWYLCKLLQVSLVTFGRKQLAVRLN